MQTTTAPVLITDVINRKKPYRFFLKNCTIAEQNVLIYSLLFISAYELWFKQILYEINSVRNLFMNPVCSSFDI